MQKISKETLLEAAHNLKFEITDEQLLILMEECEDIMSAIEQIKKIPNIDSVEPMVFPYEITSSYLREDEAASPLNQQDAIKNASNVKDGQIVLPKVVK